MISFIHTADLQIGMAASGVGSLAKKIQDARVQSLGTVLDLARTKKVDFVLIAGDLFDSNRISKRLLSDAVRCLELVKPLRVFVLPGNHDFLGASSIYNTDEFQKLGDHVTILRDEKPVTLPEMNLAIYGAPCFERYSNASPAKSILKQPGTRFNVAVLHGSISARYGGNEAEDDYYPVSEEDLKALKMDYVALGHWHSLNPDPVTDPNSCFYYSGTPEPTGFGETKSGFVLYVELGANGRVVTPISTAHYRYVDISATLVDAASLESLRRQVEQISSPETRLVRLAPKGVISLEMRNQLDKFIHGYENHFAYLRMDDSGVILEPSEADLGQFTPGGIAQTAFQILNERKKTAATPEVRSQYERAIALAYHAFKGDLE